MNSASATKGLPAMAPSTSCLLIEALIPVLDSSVNISVTWRLSNHCISHLPFPLLGYRAHSHDSAVSWVPVWEKQ